MPNALTSLDAVPTREGARAKYVRGVVYLMSRDTLMILRVDTLRGSVTKTMNFTLSGFSRKNILETE